jgi:hypothetical protein
MSRHSEPATSSRGLTGLRQPRLVILSPLLITVRINRAREPLAPWALIAFAYCDILASTDSLFVYSVSFRRTVQIWD